jgi:ABC-type transporter Mla subunit MlaD
VERIAAIKVPLGGVVIASTLAAATLLRPSTQSSPPEPVAYSIPPELERAVLDGRGHLTSCFESATRVDRLVQKNADAVNEIIARADNAAKDIEAISNELRGLSKDADPEIKVLLDNLDQASADAKDLVATAKKELQDTGDKLRGKLQKLDGIIDNTRSITKKELQQTGDELHPKLDTPRCADRISGD